MFYYFDVIHRGMNEVIGGVSVECEDEKTLDEVIDFAKKSSKLIYEFDLDVVDVELQLVTKDCDLEAIKQVAAKSAQRIHLQSIAASN